MYVTANWKFTDDAGKKWADTNWKYQIAASDDTRGLRATNGSIIPLLRIPRVRWMMEQCAVLNAIYGVGTHWVEMFDDDGTSKGPIPDSVDINNQFIHVHKVDHPLAKAKTYPIDGVPGIEAFFESIPLSHLTTASEG